MGEIATKLSPEVTEKLLTSIIDSSYDAIYSKTAAGVIMSWNRAAERIYGYQASEVIGWPVTLLGHPDRPNDIEETIARVRRGDRVENYETVRMRKDGNPVSISLTMSPIHDAQGILIGLSSIVRDITERKGADEKLRASKCLLTRAGVSYKQPR